MLQSNNNSKCCGSIKCLQKKTKKTFIYYILYLFIHYF